MHRYTYRDLYARVHRLAHVLQSLGLQPGDRVGIPVLEYLPSPGTLLCCSLFRHGAAHSQPAALGRPTRLHYQSRRRSGDLCRPVVANLLDPIRDRIPCVERIIVMPDGGSGDYEELLAAAPETPFAWPSFDEWTAAACCYTSGTTGNPKGVLYTHRSLVLHSYGLCLADSFGFSRRDTILIIVPMFHANGWGCPGPRSWRGRSSSSTDARCNRSTSPFWSRTNAPPSPPEYPPSSWGVCVPREPSARYLEFPARVRWWLGAAAAVRGELRQEI